MIAVDGATGYLGNHVVNELRKQGAPVRCIVHSGARERDIQFLQSTGAEVVTSDLSSTQGSARVAESSPQGSARVAESSPQGSARVPRAPAEALKGCSTVIHLVGSIAPKRGEKLEDLHAGQTKALVEACMAAGVSKIVQVTALGTAGNAASSYHKTKFQAEEIIRNSGLNYVILRPSLIVGREVGNRDSKLIARYRQLIQARPRVPLIAGGSNKLQPVFVGDLAKAFARAVLEDRFNGGTYEIGGPQVLTMRQLVEKLMDTLGIRKPIMPLPPMLGSIVAGVLEAVQDVPLLSRDQITLATHDNICSENALQSEFGIEPTALDTALASYASTTAQNVKAGV